MRGGEEEALRAGGGRQHPSERPWQRLSHLDGEKGQEGAAHAAPVLAGGSDPDA